MDGMSGHRELPNMHAPRMTFGGLVDIVELLDRGMNAEELLIGGG